MPRAADVTPRRWTNSRVLFDNGWYSLIAGEYLNNDGTTNDHAIGERWNGGRGELGFPNVSTYAVWHVVPDFLELPILNGLIARLAEEPGEQVRDGNVLAGPQAAATRTQRVLTEIANRE